MTHKELVSAIASKTKQTKVEVEKMMEELVLVFEENLSSGKSIGIQGFGTLEVKKKEERISVHPVTKERLLVPPKLVVGFKQSNVFKDKLKAVSYE